MPYQNPIIEFDTDEDFIYLRFRYLSRPRLMLELELLKHRIGDRRWLPDERCWQLAKTDLQVIALFAYERFGPNTLIPIKKSRKPSQMELPLYE